MLNSRWLHSVRTLVLLLLSASLISPSAKAIGPHGDVFAGFSTDGHLGWAAAAHVKVLPFVGIEGEVGGYDYDLPLTTPKAYTFLVGPRVTVGAFRLKLFAHALVGRVEPAGGSGSPSGAFLYGLGGGADLPVFSRLKWRVSADYLGVPGGNHVKPDTGRFSTGPVLRF